MGTTRRLSYHLSKAGEGGEEMAGVLGSDSVEVFAGLATGLDGGGEDAGFLRLADVVVGVADVDGAAGHADKDSRSQGGN
jgi:hypothetical protein